MPKFCAICTAQFRYDEDVIEWLFGCYVDDALIDDRVDCQRFANIKRLKNSLLQ